MRIVAVDIETSGLDFWDHEVIEVGIASFSLINPGKVVLQKAFSLNFDERASDPEALKVNGWGEREFAPKVSFDEAANIMKYWLGPTDTGEGTLVIASPAHFDIGFLAAWHQRYGFPIPWGHRNIIDLKSLACGKWGVMTALGNRDIRALLDVDEHSDHTAAQDAVYTLTLAKELMKL